MFKIYSTWFYVYTRYIYMQRYDHVVTVPTYVVSQRRTSLYTLHSVCDHRLAKERRGWDEKGMAKGIHLSLRGPAGCILAPDFLCFFFCFLQYVYRYLSLVLSLCLLLICTAGIGDYMLREGAFIVLFCRTDATCSIDLSFKTENDERKDKLVGKSVSLFADVRLAGESEKTGPRGLDIV